MAALSRIANGTHRQVQLQPGDTVIFLLVLSLEIPLVSISSSTPFQKLALMLSMEKSKYPYLWARRQQEQKLMLRLIKPKYFMPVHGEYRMQKVHAGLAMDTGIPKRISLS